MRAYLDLVHRVLEHGEVSGDRTGTGTISLFGPQVEYDLTKGFPILTTKKVKFDLVVLEMLWFLRGETNVDTLGCKIWDEWADEEGQLGPIYGLQWRKWGSVVPGAGNDWWLGKNGIDQISEAIRMVKESPSSRRNLVSAWNVSDLAYMALPPCHVMFQLHVSGKFLDMKMYQRSADLALGAPFNVASYALLLSMIANECDKIPRMLIHTIGDAHVYLNHVDGLRKQLLRVPMPPPALVLAKKPVLDMRAEDISLEGYRHHPFIKFDVSV